MIDRSIARMAAIVVCLGGLSQASPVGANSDLSCAAREGNASLSSQTCSAGSTRDATRGPGICTGETARPRPAATSLFALMMMKPVHPKLCLKANSSAPLSHLALQAEP